MHPDEQISEPSWRGHLDTRLDALHLVHAARLGYIHLIPRRPGAAEMREIIDAGTLCVFVIQGKFNNWNDFSTQWTHLHNGTRRQGYTNSISATVTPEFRKKITRFQIGSKRYQVVCYHNDVSMRNKNLDNFPAPVLDNDIPIDEYNTNTTLYFRPNGYALNGCERYEWVPTAADAQNYDAVYDQPAPGTRSIPLDIPPPCTGDHDALIAGLYPQENITYKYKYRYKKTVLYGQLGPEASNMPHGWLHDNHGHDGQVHDGHGHDRYGRDTHGPVPTHQLRGPPPVTSFPAQRNYYEHLSMPPGARNYAKAPNSATTAQDSAGPSARPIQQPGVASTKRYAERRTRSPNYHASPYARPSFSSGHDRVESAVEFPYGPPTTTVLQNYRPIAGQSSGYSRFPPMRGANAEEGWRAVAPVASSTLVTVPVREATADEYRYESTRRRREYTRRRRPSEEPQQGADKT